MFGRSTCSRSIRAIRRLHRSDDGRRDHRGAEPAEDVVERLEAEAREEDDALLIKEHRNHGHFPR